MRSVETAVEKQIALTSKEPYESIDSLGVSAGVNAKGAYLACSSIYHLVSSSHDRSVKASGKVILKWPWNLEGDMIAFRKAYSLTLLIDSTAISHSYL